MARLEKVNHKPGTSSSSSSISAVLALSLPPVTVVASFFKLARLSPPSWLRMPGNISANSVWRGGYQNNYSRLIKVVLIHIFNLYFDTLGSIPNTSWTLWPRTKPMFELRAKQVLWIKSGTIIYGIDCYLWIDWYTIKYKWLHSFACIKLQQESRVHDSHLSGRQEVLGRVCIFQHLLDRCWPAKYEKFQEVFTTVRGTDRLFGDCPLL